MLETGKVVEVKQNYATVEFLRNASCEKCGSCFSAGDKNMRVEVINSLDAKIGDCVQISISKNTFFAATTLLYALPVAIFIVSIVISAKLSGNDIITMATGLLSTALVFFVLRIIDPKLKTSNKFLPKMINIV